MTGSLKNGNVSKCGGVNSQEQKLLKKIEEIKDHREKVKQNNLNREIWLEDIATPGSIKLPARPSFVPKLWDAYIRGPIWFNHKTDGKITRSTSKSTQQRENGSIKKATSILKVNNNKPKKQQSYVSGKKEIKGVSKKSLSIEIFPTKPESPDKKQKKPEIVPTLWDDDDDDEGGPIWFNNSNNKNEIQDIDENKNYRMPSNESKLICTEQNAVIYTERDHVISRTSKQVITPHIVPKLWDAYDQDEGPIWFIDQENSIDENNNSIQNVNGINHIVEKIGDSNSVKPDYSQTPLPLKQLGAALVKKYNTSKPKKSNTVLLRHQCKNTANTATIKAYEATFEVSKACQYLLQEIVETHEYLTKSGTITKESKAVYSEVVEHHDTNSAIDMDCSKQKLASIAVRCTELENCMKMIKQKVEKITEKFIEGRCTDLENSMKMVKEKLKKMTEMYTDSSSMYDPENAQNCKSQKSFWKEKLTKCRQQSQEMKMKNLLGMTSYTFR